MKRPLRRNKNTNNKASVIAQTSCVQERNRNTVKRTRRTEKMRLHLNSQGQGRAWLLNCATRVLTRRSLRAMKTKTPCIYLAISRDWAADVLHVSAAARAALKFGMTKLSLHWSLAAASRLHVKKIRHVYAAGHEAVTAAILHRCCNQVAKMVA